MEPVRVGWHGEDGLRENMVELDLTEDDVQDSGKWRRRIGDKARAKNTKEVTM